MSEDKTHDESTGRNNAPSEFPSVEEWLKTPRSEKEKAQYAALILKKHFDRNALKLRESDPPVSWSLFGWDLYFNIGNFVRDGEQQSMLKELLAELTDFCEAAFGDFFAYYLFVYIEKFIDRDPPYSRFVPLLPDKARAQFGAINEIMQRQYEEDLERQNQMGY